MIPDIFPTLNTWTNVYAATGIAVGTRLQIQSKREYPCMIWEGATAPGVTGDDNRQGYELTMAGGPVKTSAAPAGVWVMPWSSSDKGAGRLCVQEYIA